MRASITTSTTTAVLALLVAATPAFAQPISNLSEGTTRTTSKASLAIGGYAEVFYQWNFNEPSNGLTNLRGFDNRHNSFTIANAVIDAAGNLGPVSARVALQIGLTPDTYYLSEPTLRGSSSVAASSREVWKFLQQAWVAYKIPLGRGLLVDGGIFLSPIGPEGMAIKEQWNWSRSDLFFGLPFYHTGFRLTYGFTDRFTASLQMYNGWNSVVDNNAEKSIAAQFTYAIPDRLTFQFLYFTGVERPTGAPEGRPWRHLFDSYLAAYPRKWLSILVHANGGFEPNVFGTSGWAAGALYVRFQPLAWMYIALRGDLFWEHVASNASGSAAPIFWPVEWVSSATGTLDFRPVENLSLRLEYRHDQAAGDAYFAGTVPTDLAGAFIANATAQDTVTVGMTTWF